MLRWIIALSCLVLAALGLVEGTETSRPNKVFSKDYVQRFLADADLPPIELDMQLDFEIAPTIGASSRSNRSARQAAKPKPKKKVPVKANKPPKIVPPTTTRQVAKKKSHSLSRDIAELRRRIQSASGSIFEHKYAGILWASLLIVWAPLLIIFIVNRFMGKEAFIDVLVRVLPEGFPARYIEMVIEDALWVGIFGVVIIATLGTFLVEMATLGVDIGKTLSQDSRSKRSRKLRK